jgi:hypothetical protein
MISARITVDNSVEPKKVVIPTKVVQKGSPTRPVRFYISDVLGRAATNNITISLENGTINGQPKFVVDTDNYSAVLFVDGANGEM